MSVKFGLAALAAVLVATVSTAKADSGFYLGGSAGAGFRQDDSRQRTLNGLSGPFTQTEDYQYTTAFDLAVSGGYRFDLGATGAIRTEVEFGYGTYSLDKIAVSTPGAPDRTARPSSGADFNSYAATVNAFYDLPLAGRFVPYVGGGLGFQHTDESDGTGTVAGPLQSVPTHFQGGSSNDGIWLAEAGLSIAVTDRISIVPAYRYVQTFDGELSTHILKVGLRYAF
jgi:opacity protein-like surface antigen